MHVVPYLNFDGDCRQAFELYNRVLGGQIVALFTFGEMPEPEHVAPEQRDWIMHARLVAGDLVLMGSDSPMPNFEEPTGLYVSLMVEEPAEAERVYQALSEGGQVVMPIQETFWATRFAMFKDRFGTPWMINCEQPMDSAISSD